MKLALTAALVVSSLSGCATVVPLNQATFDHYMSKSFDAELYECFSAVQGAFRELKLPIESSDEAAGVVISGRGAAAEISALSGRARDGSDDLRDYSVRIGVKVVDSVAERRCWVRVIQFELWRGKSSLQRVDPEWADEKLWRPLMESISEHFSMVQPECSRAVRPRPIANADASEAPCA